MTWTPILAILLGVAVCMIVVLVALLAGAAMLVADLKAERARELAELRAAIDRLAGPAGDA